MRWTVLPLLGFALGSCQPVGVTDLAGWSRPAMTSDATGPRSYPCGLTTQLETGRAASNQAAGGCSSCH